MALLVQQSALQRLSSLLRGSPPAPPPALDRLRGLLGSTRPRSSFYDLPAARNMREMGGILPEDVDVDEANRQAREGSLARKAGEVLRKGVLESPGGVFTRTLLSSAAGLGSGLAAAGAAVLPGKADEFSGQDQTPLDRLADLLDRASGSLLPAQERQPFHRQLLANPGRAAVTSIAQAAPYLGLAAAFPLAGTGLMAGSIGGQESRRLEAEGVAGAENLLASAGSGLSQAVLERLPVGRALRGLSGSLGRRALRGMAMEVPTEMLQEIPPVVADVALGLRADESTTETLQELAGRMGDAGLAAMAPGALLGAVAPAGRPLPAPARSPGIIERSLGAVRGGADRRLAATTSRAGEAGQAKIPYAESFPAARAVRSKLRRLFLPHRGLPERIAGERFSWIARQEAAVLEMEETSKELARVIQRHDYGGAPRGLQSEQQLVRFLDDGFRGLVAPKTVQKLAPEAAPVLERMTLQRDRFARGLRKAGALDEHVSAELERHFGLYVHRTYQAKFDESWQERMQAEHGPTYARGAELWRDTELQTAYQKLRELNPELSIGAAKEQVLRQWDEAWRAGRIDPDTRRVKLDLQGERQPALESIQIGERLRSTSGDSGQVAWVDPATQMVTLEVWDRQNRQKVATDVHVEELRRRQRLVQTVDNPKQVEGSYLAALRWSNRGGSMLPGDTMEAAKNLNLKKQRDRKLLDWRRHLLGEVRDVRTNYLGTMAQMVHLAETERYLRRLADAGREEGLFFPQPEGQATERIDPNLLGVGRVEGREQADAARALLAMPGAEYSPEQRAALEGIMSGVRVQRNQPRTSPVGEMYATKELADALRNEIRKIGPGYRTWETLAHVAKANQTIYAPQASNRNYFSNMFYLLANGHNPAALLGLDRVARDTQAHKVAYSRVAQDLFNLGADVHLAGTQRLEEALTTRLSEYVRLGIAHQSTDVGDLHRLARHAYRILRNREKPNALRHAKELAQDTYLAHDDVAKIIEFEKEVRTFREAYPNLQELAADPMNGLDPATLERLRTEHQRNRAVRRKGGVQGAELDAEVYDGLLKKMAAKKVRGTMQNYQELPEFWKALSANPVLAPFLSFRISLVRNAANITMIGLEESQSSNPVIRARGWQRLGGFALALSLPSAIGQFLQQATDTDDDELEALRKIGFPWSRNASLALLENKNGKLSYFDAGHTEVWDDLREPFIGAMREGSWTERAERAFFAVLENFTGLELESQYGLPFTEEIFLSAVFDLSRNRRKTGGPVFQEADSGLRKAWKSALHAWEVAGPGIARSAQKIAYAALGKKSPGGRDYQLGNEIIALGGPRIVTLDLRDRLGDHAAQWNAERRAAGSLLGTTKRPEDLAGAAKRSQAATEQAVDRFMDLVRSYRTLGLEEREVREILNRERVGGGLARSFAAVDRQRALLILSRTREQSRSRLTRELTEEN